MNNMVVCIYLLGINVVAFLAFFADKAKAKLHRWRIPEATLLMLCVLGGSVGGLLGMLLFRHKIRKPAFYVGVPMILIIQIIVLFVIWKGMGG